MSRQLVYQLLVAKIAKFLQGLSTQAGNGVPTISRLEVGQLEKRVMFSASPLVLLGDGSVDTSGGADMDSV